MNPDRIILASLDFILKRPIIIIRAVEKKSPLRCHTIRTELNAFRAIISVRLGFIYKSYVLEAISLDLRMMDRKYRTNYCLSINRVIVAGEIFRIDDRRIIAGIYFARQIRYIFAITIA